MPSTAREYTEQVEDQILAPWAAKSRQSRGRLVPEEECPLRTCYQRDRDRIIHCKSFRRLKQKTQVFLSPEGDHYRTRLTHTLEVNQIARTIARALRLNEDLTEAIALGHDLGHTPFGHAGERALNKLCPGGFKHYQQSVRVVDKLEKNFQGLNLTWEVRNGIICHTKGKWAATLEGQAVRYADRIAYMNHDIEDAITAGVLSPQALPTEIVQVLGDTKSRRISTLIQDLVANSGAKNLSFSPLVGEAYEALHRLCGQGCQAGRAEGGKGHRRALRAHAGGPGPSARRLFADRLSGRGGPGGHRLYQRHERRVRHPHVRRPVRAQKVARSLTKAPRKRG